MASRISLETFSLIHELYSRGESIPDIAKLANVSYATAYRNTRVLERGFADRMTYEDFIASQNGFVSYNAYKKALAKSQGFKTRGEYETRLVKTRGFSSYV